MKNIFKIFSVIMILLSLNVNAQIVTNELPLGITNKNDFKVIPTEIIKTPDMELIRNEDIKNDSKDSPIRYAYAISVNYNISNSGNWTILQDGSKIWRLKVKLVNALSSNAFFDKFWLPIGSKFFVYNEKTHQTIGAITSKYIDGSKNNPSKFATGLIYGEEVIFEYFSPPYVKDIPEIVINRIDYGYRFIDDPYKTDKNFGQSGSCNINVNCPEGMDWQKEKNAIARISIVLPNGSAWCSCALINNTNEDNTPYVLTANHCIARLYDAINNSDLPQCIFYWKYEYKTCTNTNIEPTNISTLGAEVKANSAFSDFALLKLRQDPNSIPNVKIYYLGWDRSGDPGNGGVGIHHPMGDVKKISQYSIIPQSTTYLNDNISYNETHWQIIWSKGVTEGGSSGSPLINSNRKVIGQLHGGYSNCISNGIYGPDKPDWYGKFSVSWTGNGATDNRRKLQPWLDPQNTGAIVLDGKGTVPDTPADLLIRDYVGDDGEEPSYGYNGWLYKLLQYNPDIKLLDIDTQQPIHSIGMYKKKNCYIAVNIKNIGGKTTEGNGKERLHLFSQSYLITTLPKYVLPYYERLTPTKGLPIGKLAYNEQKVAAGLFNWELPEKKLIATAERLKKAFPSVNNPIWGFDILAIADENGNSIIKSTADTVFIAHGAEDIARRYNSAAMGYWQRRTLWDEIFNQIIRILPTANKPFSLSLSQPVDIKRGRIKDFAEVNILLSNNLMTKLITAGNPKIKVIDQNRVRLLSADAKLEFRPVSNDRDDYFAGVEVKFFSDLLPQRNSFDFGLSYSEQGKEPEMVHFTAIRDSSVYFKAQAEASKTQVAGNETVTLTATNIGDEATYTWYNRSGNVIGTGTSITTVPTATDTYTLEVEREDNGYKSYGEVEVVALAGKIVSLSPNPAHSTLTVKYKLPDNAVIASIQITNIQNNISKTYEISTTATEKTISLEGLSVGSYIVKLIADGKTLHSQNLLIK